MYIKPKLALTLQEFINTQDLFAIKSLHEGVVHIGFPDQMQHNIQRFQNCFASFGLEPEIYYAHKSSKNPCFVKHAYEQGIKIDVASKNELLSALQAGFSGEKIEATGPKNNDFLTLAIKNNCLISIDSQSELERIIQIQTNLDQNQKVRILIRLNNLPINGRSINLKPSRFGINYQELPQLYLILVQYENILLEGFHFHVDGYDASMKGGFLDSMLEVLKSAYYHGFQPTILNIGGAFRDQTLQDYQDWTSYIESIESDMVNQNQLPTWGNQTFGLYLNSNNRISGKEKALSKFYSHNFEDDINTLLSHPDSQNRPLSEVLLENMITLAIEPGYALLQQCGISLVQVIESKKASDGRNLVVVDANIYNLGLAKMFQFYTDPILVANPANLKNKIQSSSQSDFQAFIVGNLCREDDFLVDRLIHFPQVPQNGDILIFTNTAAYYAGFEDGSPIMHPTSSFVTATKKQNQWQIQ